jgi:hypothetical protein
LTIPTTKDSELLHKHLIVLRISHLAEWDVLAFIYRHGTNLASVDYIGRLLGHSKAAVGAALDSLTSTGLVKRSRSAHGVGLYQIAPALAGDFRGIVMGELMKLTEERRGRMLMIAHLRQAGNKELRGRGHGGLHLA